MIGSIMGEVWAALVGAGISFLIGWGMMRSKVNELERRVGLNEKSADRQLELFHSLRDVYVSYQHFNEIMSTVREGQRELKEDMKRVLELLTERV